jgi:nucleoside-diphosphate-sugar epimerase/SAM-dependent methyltransferase
MAIDAVHRAAPHGSDGRLRSHEASVEVLLGRPALDVDDGRFAEYLAGATVLVTGAAGFVGSHLCARIARLGARELVLVDQAEAALSELMTDLRYDHGVCVPVPVLADIRNRARTIEVFERYRPAVVFHAAAYKQVPLLEASPVEAVANNVLGTKWVVDAACRVDVERFVMFSTDKAVRPTSVLGRTKAIAEWIVSAAGRAQGRHGRYASIRLANVVDSPGSILPLFRRQVASGGPVTVTHPHATRYLMTAGEAAGLAVVAGALADSCGIFWLDLGPPVRVLDFARRLIDVSPYNVEIEFLGLRSGERMHEQLCHRDEDSIATACERLFRSSIRAVDSLWLDSWLAELAEHVDRASASGVRAALAAIDDQSTQKPPSRAHVRRRPWRPRPTTLATRRYFEKRALAFDRLHDRSTVATRALRSGPARGCEFAVSIVARHRAPSVLDLGCGPGRVAEAILGAGASDYVGIDLSARMLSLARERLERFDAVQLHEGDFLDMDIPRTFDVVLALGLFDYLDAPARAAEWIRARCSSVLVASFARWDWVKGPVRHLHYELIHRCPIVDHTEAEIEALLHDAGFANVEFPIRGRRGFFVSARVPGFARIEPALR